MGQRTFVADADAPPKPRLAKAIVAPGAPPLVVIDFPTSADLWIGPLKVAVGLARARKADVLFTVQSAVPPGATPADDAARLSRAVTQGEEVAGAIVADGIDRLQVQMTATTVPGLARDQVRVFVH